jgi:hypothetical protein
MKNIASELCKGVVEKKAPIKMRYKGTLARQFIMGATIIVASLAFSSGMALVAMTAGIAQPPT